MKKGILVFYINYFPDSGQKVEDIINIVRQQNKDLIDKLEGNGEGDYKVMFVPTTKEASRVEKIDFDQPHPRFVGKMHERDEE